MSSTYHEWVKTESSIINDLARGTIMKTSFVWYEGEFIPFLPEDGQFDELECAAGSNQSKNTYYYVSTIVKSC